MQLEFHQLDRRWEHQRHDRGRHNGWNRGGSYDQRYNQSYYGGYNQRVAYDEPVYQNTRVWRGEDGRNYCRHRDGTTGLLIGGALVGRAIDKNGSRCR